jgi:hypothetical protein
VSDPVETACEWLDTGFPVRKGSYDSAPNQ